MPLAANALVSSSSGGRVKRSLECGSESSAAEIEEGRAGNVALVVVGAPAFGVVAAFGPRPQIGRAVEDAKRRRAHAAREFLGRNQRRGMRHVALPGWESDVPVTPSGAKRSRGASSSADSRLRSGDGLRRVRSSSAAAAGRRRCRAAAPAGAAGAAAGRLRAGRRGRGLLGLLLWSWSGAALGVAWACSFFRHALREVLLFRVWQ